MEWERDERIFSSMQQIAKSLGGITIKLRDQWATVPRLKNALKDAPKNKLEAFVAAPSLRVTGGPTDHNRIRIDWREYFQGFPATRCATQLLAEILCCVAYDGWGDTDEGNVIPKHEWMHALHRYGVATAGAADLDQLGSLVVQVDLAQVDSLLRCLFPVRAYPTLGFAAGEKSTEYGKDLGTHSLAFTKKNLARAVVLLGNIYKRMQELYRVHEQQSVIGDKPKRL